MLRLQVLVFAVIAAAPLALQAGEYELVAHLQHRNLGRLERAFWEIADPDHPNYLRHLSLDEVGHIVGSTDEEISTTSEWLVNMGARSSSVRVSALRDTVTATFASDHGRTLTQTAVGKPAFITFVVRRDPRDGNTLGSGDSARHSTQEHDSVGSDDSYTISNMKKAWGIPGNLQATNTSTLQMVWGPGTFGYSTTQLLEHKVTQCPLLNMDKVKFDTANHGKSGGDNFGEGNLDTKMISSFGLNVETVVSNTNTTASTEEGTGFGQAFLDFATELAARKTLPHVLSLSLGSLASASCDLLCSEAVKMGITMEKCIAFLQTQRQVCMFLSQAQTLRISTALQVLGVRGVSVFGSSGDGGSHFSFGKFPGGEVGDALNTISCKFQMPVFPTSSPYIISVGGTMWKSSSSEPTTWAGFGGGSGSGFSWEFDMPEYQKGPVAFYLNGTQGLPPASSFNANGRAFPDVSAIAVEGTSQSCPIMAGIFSMIMDIRLNAGLPPLGFVAPRIWKLAQQHVGEAFEDVPTGNSKTSCDNGFPSIKGGWDPNTGWGRPVWAGLVKLFGSDDQVLARTAPADVVV